MTEATNSNISNISHRLKRSLLRVSQNVNIMRQRREGLKDDSETLTNARSEKNLNKMLKDDANIKEAAGITDQTSAFVATFKIIGAITKNSLTAFFSPTRFFSEHTLTDDRTKKEITVPLTMRALWTRIRNKNDTDEKNQRIRIEGKPQDLESEIKKQQTLSVAQKGLNAIIDETSKEDMLGKFSCYNEEDNIDTKTKQAIDMLKATESNDKLQQALKNYFIADGLTEKSLEYSKDSPDHDIDPPSRSEISYETVDDYKASDHYNHLDQNRKLHTDQILNQTDTSEEDNNPRCREIILKYPEMWSSLDMHPYPDTMRTTSNILKKSQSVSDFLQEKPEYREIWKKLSTHQMEETQKALETNKRAADFIRKYLETWQKLEQIPIFGKTDKKMSTTREILDQSKNVCDFLSEKPEHREMWCDLNCNEYEDKLRPTQTALDLENGELTEIIKTQPDKWKNMNADVMKAATNIFKTGSQKIKDYIKNAPMDQKSELCSTILAYSNPTLKEMIDGGLPDKKGKWFHLTTDKMKYTMNAALSKSEPLKNCVENNFDNWARLDAGEMALTCKALSSRKHLSPLKDYIEQDLGNWLTFGQKKMECTIELYGDEFKHIQPKNLEDMKAWLDLEAEEMQKKLDH